MWNAILSRFSHPCEETDLTDDIMFDVGVDVLSGMWIVVMNTLTFFGKVADAVDVLTAVIIDVVSTSDVDMLTDENETGLATVMTPLEFTLTSPLEEPIAFC